jgi:UDP-N-acetylmuramate dehydrogenase
MKVIEQADLIAMNSLALPCTATRMIQLSSFEDLKAIFSAYALNKGNYLLIGSGSNLVLPEKLDKTVLRFDGSEVQYHERGAGVVYVEAGAGVLWDQLVEDVVARGLRGLENLSLIPGTVGAAPVQNIGAYGVELADNLVSVAVFNVESQQLETIQNEDCDFSYRDSVFKRNPGKFCILSVTLKLSRNTDFVLGYGDLRELKQRTELSVSAVRDCVVSARNVKLPDPSELPNSGSFFKNPVISTAKASLLRQQFPDLVSYALSPEQEKLAAGWLIDKAGWKGYREQHAGIHTQQALVLVNHKHARQSDILSLAEKIQGSILKIFDVCLEIEPVVL